MFHWVNSSMSLVTGLVAMLQGVPSFVTQPRNVAPASAGLVGTGKGSSPMAVLYLTTDLPFSAVSPS